MLCLLSFLEITYSIICTTPYGKKVRDGNISFTSSASDLVHVLVWPVVGRQQAIRMHGVCCGTLTNTGRYKNKTKTKQKKENKTKAYALGHEFKLTTLLPDVDWTRV